MEAWIDIIDLKISHESARKLLEELRAQKAVAMDVESLHDYLSRNFCTLASDRSHIIVESIDIDGYDQDLYAFLERLEQYVEDGGLIRFKDEGGWSVALYENGKLRVHGSLAAYQAPKQETEISERLGERGHDGNTYLYDESPAQAKLESFWYWRNGCLKMALYAASLGEQIASLEGLDKAPVETLHGLTGSAFEILAGRETLTKDDVNSFAKEAPRISARLTSVVSKIESRSDADDLLILRGFYQ